MNANSIGRRERVQDDCGYTATLLDLDADGYARIAYEPGQTRNDPNGNAVSTHPTWVPVSSITRIGWTEGVAAATAAELDLLILVSLAESFFSISPDDPYYSPEDDEILPYGPSI